VPTSTLNLPAFGTGIYSFPEAARILGLRASDVRASDVRASDVRASDVRAGTLRR
jgi:hypothetical protein